MTCVVAATHDGGKHFPPPGKIHAVRFRPDGAPSSDTRDDPADRWTRGGVRCHPLRAGGVADRARRQPRRPRRGVRRRAGPHASRREPPHMVPTRHGDVPAQFYMPDGETSRAVLLVPGIHSMGIEEPRLTALAEGPRRQRRHRDDDGAARPAARTGSRRERPTYRGRGGVDGGSGPISRPTAASASSASASPAACRSSAAGRDRRSATRWRSCCRSAATATCRACMRYLATGEAPQVAGRRDASAARLRRRGDPVRARRSRRGAGRSGRSRCATASRRSCSRRSSRSSAWTRRTRRSRRRARWRRRCPSRRARYMTYVNDRESRSSGPRSCRTSTSSAPTIPRCRRSARRPPAAPVFLLHGDDDTVIPAAEAALLGELPAREGRRRARAAERPHHARRSRSSAAASETWKLVSFWASVLRQ